MLENRDLSPREKFFMGDSLKIGQIVEDTFGVYEILDRGVNYVSVVNENGNILKKFITDLTISENDSISYRSDPKKLSFKGYIPSEPFLENTEAVKAFSDTVKRYTNCSIVDAIAILKSIDAVDSIFLAEKLYLDNKSINKQLDRYYSIAYTCLTKIGEYKFHSGYLNKLTCLTDNKNIKLHESMDNIKSNDKLKVAAVIAQTFNVESNGSSAEMMVNNALRAARKNPMSVKGESLKILTRMLELAKSVGIKYDENIVKTPTEVSESFVVKNSSGKIVHTAYSENSAKVKAESLSTGGEKHTVSFDRVASPKLNELSLDTLKAASSAKHTTPSKSIDHTLKRFGSAQKTQDKLHTADLDRIAKLHEGTSVEVTREFGKKSTGKIKGYHGSVVEVSFKNGKVGFYHNHQVNEIDKIEEDKQVSVTKKDLTNLNTDSSNLDPTKKEKLTEPGNTMSVNNTNRMQIVKKLKGL